MPRPNLKQITENIREMVAFLSDGELLPMPHRDMANKVSFAEIEEYHQRVERYRRIDPYYEGKFGRPTEDTVTQLWKLLSPYLSENFAGVTEYEKQALLIVLETFINAGLNARNISYNQVFDALCRRYSDHYLRSPAKVVRDMREDTASDCRRDLLLNGIEVNKLWRFVVGEWSGELGKNPLFCVQKLTYTGKGQHIRVFLKRDSGTLLSDFLNVIGEDRHYTSVQPPTTKALFVDREPHDQQYKYEVLYDKLPEAREMCAEVSYNEVKLGEKSRGLLRLQAEARLLLNVAAFKKDYEEARSKESELSWRLKNDYDIDPLISDIEREIGGREIWSAREAHLYYRSLEEGIKQKQGESEQHSILEEANEKLKRNPEKWERRLAGYLKWQKENGREKDDFCCSVSEKELVKAAIVSWGWRQEVRILLADYDRARRHLQEYQQVYEQLQDKDGYQPIRSHFSRVINRRYQPLHLWPNLVTSRSHIQHRKRWFKALDPETGGPCDLIGFDISSSQTQIIATLLSVEKLETLTMATAGESFKQVMAKWAWNRHQDPADPFELREARRSTETIQNYEGPEDTRLLELCKHLWMRVSYGSSAWSVVEDQKEDPRTYGPGWKTENANRFLRGLYDEFPEVEKFLQACRRVAEVAYERDPCAGVKFVDPSDGTVVRWNPVARADKKISNNGCKLILSLPGKIRKEKFTDAKPPARDVRERRAGGKIRKEKFIDAEPCSNGEYPVNLEELSKMIAPCLVHMLDAYYSTLVMERLSERGVTDLVGIHDCWLVPAKVRIKGMVCEGSIVLQQVMEEVASKWYAGLESVYEDLLSYLSAEPVFGDLIRAAQKKWIERRQNGYRPAFLAKPS